MKEQIQHWLDGMPYQTKLVSDSELNPDHEFRFVIGDKPPKVSIFTRKALPTRLFVLGSVKFSEQHQKLILEMPPHDMNKILLNLSDKAITYGVILNFNMADQKISGYNIHSFIQYVAVDEDRFYQTVERMISVQLQLLNHINVSLGILTVPKTQDDSSSSMYK